MWRYCTECGKRFASGNNVCPYCCFQNRAPGDTPPAEEKTRARGLIGLLDDFGAAIDQVLGIKPHSPSDQRGFKNPQEPGYPQTSGTRSDQRTLSQITIKEVDDSLVQAAIIYSVGDFIVSNLRRGRELNERDELQMIEDRRHQELMQAIRESK